MSGYNPYGLPPQYPPPQSQLYPVMAPQPGQPATQPAQPYPYQPGFAYAYPGQPGAVPSAPGIAPTAPYPGQMGGAPGMAPAPAAFSYAGYANAAPQQGYGPAIEWIPSSTTEAASLSDRAVVAGYEGHDGSPLWVIRARFEGDLIPGKFAAKHRAAYVPWGSKENSVERFEVCCARPERIRWIEARDGAVPPNAVVAGNSAAGEPLYIGRAKHEGSLTPGKVHPSHKNMYISFGGQEIPKNTYEVLCTI
ncbi:uncharacterized protein LOC125242310 [Leguminivora glycinivorella]|uniref:uncharacterized protein LOC125242310 n=1 Tax=Leguminivora glycinivorella TaxID=1035111 RepID=UPI00200CE5E0|nr:uncharacterized protein LOC125242310 [Leguminivora glycinivorella]